MDQADRRSSGWRLAALRCGNFTLVKPRSESLSDRPTYPHTHTHTHTPPWECVFVCVCLLFFQLMCLYAWKWTSVIDKVLVSVSSQYAYLITYLCTLVQLVVSGLSISPAVLFFFSFFFFRWLYDCSLCCGVVGLFVVLFCFYIGNLFCVFLWAHCTLAFSWGLCAIEISCIIIIIIRLEIFTRTAPRLSGLWMTLECASRITCSPKPSLLVARVRTVKQRPYTQCIRSLSRHCQWDY